MSFYTRLADPMLVLLKQDAPFPGMGGKAQDEKPRDRAEAARRAWIVRKERFGPGGGNVGKGGEKPVGNKKNKAPAQDQPRQGGNSGEINRDLRDSMDKLMNHLSKVPADKNPVSALPWAKTRPKGHGINTSGFMDVDGKRYFGKVQQEIESDIELGVWNVAQKLGWDDMSRPTVKETITARADGGGRGHKRGLTIQPLMPEGDVIGNRHVKPNMAVEKGHRMILFDYAVGGGDRHQENFWVDNKGDVFGIDYARSFQRHPHGRGALKNYGAVKDWKAPRALVQQIVDNEQTIIDSIPKKGGYETTRDEAVAGVKERMNKLRTKLLAHNDDKIDLSWMDL